MIDLNVEEKVILRGWLNDRHFVEVVIRIFSMTRDEDIEKQSQILREHWPSIERFEILPFQ